MSLDSKLKKCNLSLKTKSFIFDVNQIAKAGEKLPWVRNILFVHAFTGCDTTSHIFRIGKTKLTEAVFRDKLQEVKVFYDPQASKEVLTQVGESIGVALYRREFPGDLNELRYQLYSEAIAKNSSSVTSSVRSLCPTSAAFALHVYRVYHQIQLWLGHDSNPVVWGWKIRDNLMVPIKGGNVSPAEISTIISCGCKTGCRTSLCKCKKESESCHSACVNCNKESCYNYEIEPDAVDSEEDEEIGRVYDSDLSEDL